MNIEELKAYLNDKYQGPDSFLKHIIFQIFGEETYETGHNTELLQPNSGLELLAEQTGIRSVRQIGHLLVGIETLYIFDITVSDRVIMERNRVNIQRLVRSIMGPFTCAFMIFHYENDTRWDWRFTFCHKGRDSHSTTDSKRYTFLLGPEQSCRTAAENFMMLYDKREAIDISDIEHAFSVEKLSKEFFDKYKAHYEAFVNYMIDPDNGMRGDFIDTDFDHEGMAEDQIREREEKPIRDYVKKLLGRIVFLHFLQKKGWMGVPAGDEWGRGDSSFMLHLFERASTAQQDNFLDEVLEPLFSSALDKDRRGEGDLYDTGVEGFRNVRVPYLNGGLFERDKLDDNASKLPAHLFCDFLTMLSQYNFTIDENDPNDAEVGVDPEMLGRIFENLLEDNKGLGVYYTPKEIVQYMCRESLIAYLQTDRTEDEKARIRQFILTHDAELLGALKPYMAQQLRDVKICDPAIGSGAFPMGLLRELFFCRAAIQPELMNNPADIKRHIIQNNIYGVDIERGAVDIARLRFWLALIVDEKSPEALPNLDFKIMQGNSLLEQYKGVDLSTMTQQKIEDGVLSLYDNMIDVYRKNLRDKLEKYYACAEHEQKVELRKQIADIVRAELREQGISIDFGGIDLAANSNFFLWHTWFYDVFSRPGKEGFDIVIGNPPYRQLQNNGGELAKTYQSCRYETFARTGDIYCLFYERGHQLLSPGGHLCYITSNKWMRAGYGEKTRAFLAQKTNPVLLIDFAGIKLFETATVDTNILLYAKETNQGKTRCATLGKQAKDSIKNLSDFLSHHTSYCSFTTSDSWVILSPIEQSIKRKIEAVGTPLKDWDINIYRGVLTGCNEAFIITTDKRKEIISACQDDDERRRTEELIRPILRGKDIKRYGYKWDEKWLIATHNGVKGKFPRIDINDYPAVKAHLDQYWDKISTRADKGDTPYNLRNCAYWEDFNKPKIIYPNMTKYMPFYYDDKKYFTNQK
ncbi:MAG: Eco57I restriction-modification methylase domain-containing protein, partial [Prevotella sp.]